MTTETDARSSFTLRVVAGSAIYNYNQTLSKISEWIQAPQVR